MSLIYDPKILNNNTVLKIRSAETLFVKWLQKSLLLRGCFLRMTEKNALQEVFSLSLLESKLKFLSTILSVLCNTY